MEDPPGLRCSPGGESDIHVGDTDYFAVLGTKGTHATHAFQWFDGHGGRYRPHCYWDCVTARYEELKQSGSVLLRLDSIFDTNAFSWEMNQQAPRRRDFESCAQGGCGPVVPLWVA